MRLNPYLTFNGQCEAAFRFYEKCLGGKITLIIPYGDSPLAAETQPDMHKKVLHATFTVGDHLLQGSDASPERYRKAQGFSVNLNVSEVAEAERIFQALSEKATVTMPLQETFWARRFGMLTDQFGTPWMINCGKPQ